VIKAELLCYQCSYRFDQRTASLIFSDRGILNFAFHQVLSSSAVPLDLGESLEFHVVVLMVPLHYVGFDRVNHSNLQNNENSPHQIDIYVGPPTFSLAPQCPHPLFSFYDRHCSRDNHCHFLSPTTQLQYVHYRQNTDKLRVEINT